jgi:hypothetical protein
MAGEGGEEGERGVSGDAAPEHTVKVPGYTEYS